MILSTPEAVAIYEAYPRRVKKPHALRAILKAIDKHGFEYVIARTKEYAARAQSKELQFIPYPASFFNGEMYRDDFDALFPQGKNNNGGCPYRISELRAILKAKTDMRDALRNEFSSEGPFGRTWQDDPHRLQAQQLSNEIKTLTAQLAAS